LCKNPYRCEEVMTFLSGKYRVILADPPWSYTNWKGKDSGAAKAHYPCMSVEEIAALPVGDLAEENAALLMWITFPKMTEGAHLPIFKAWGFRPVTTAFVWVKSYASGKPYCGLGFYTRSGAEPCILGIRGRSPRRDGATNVRQILEAPRSGRHSAKPSEQYDRIEALFPGPYAEIFARNRRAGWDGWGNEFPEEE
jgi:N6-adenosine-specific RNA methylase IME4